MRYIAVGYNSELLLQDGSKFRTKFFRLAPMIDKRFFRSITEGNESLRSFFAGFIKDSKEKSVFMPSPICQESYDAGHEFREKLKNGTAIYRAEVIQAIELPDG